MGFEVDDAASGSEGLALFNRGGYALVITDLQMPDMTGWDVVDAVRRHAPLIPLLMVTGAEVDAPRARERNVLALAKPVHPDDLRRAVEQLLGARAASEAAEDRVEARTRALLADLRTSLDRVRDAVAGVAGVLGVVEGVVRAQEATMDLLTDLNRLRRESDALTREAQRLRAENETLRDERHRALAELEGLLRRLRS
jgi:DNA-binding response OmpR family regulator